MGWPKAEKPARRPSPADKALRHNERVDMTLPEVRHDCKASRAHGQAFATCDCGEAALTIMDLCRCRRSGRSDGVHRYGVPAPACRQKT